MGNAARRGSPGKSGEKAYRHLAVSLWLILVHSFFGYAMAPDKAAPARDELRSLRINSFFDPERNFLNATAKLSFAGPAEERRLWLAKELALSSVSSGTQPALDFKRDSGQFLVANDAGNELNLCYSGRMESSQDPFESATGQRNLPGPATVDDYRFLSYTKDFYPNPRIDFTPMKMTFSVPCGWNCLGSGRLCSMQSDQGVTTYEFDNNSAKGMALVCGRFIQLGLLDGPLQLRLYGAAGFNYGRYFSDQDLAFVASFLRERFGALDESELSVLFRRGRSFGGVSYSGLIVLNVDGSWTSMAAKTRKEFRRESPLSMIDAHFDLLAHEMAHQWWGGIISWKSPADNWITEGLATYANLLLQRQRQGERAYRKTLSHLRHWVKKHCQKGSCADGFKLKLQNRDSRVYQTLVYVKPVLMLAELADAIGEGELCLRLQGILHDRRMRSVDTEEFLHLLSAGDERSFARLDEWVRGRGLPTAPVIP